MIEGLTLGLVITMHVNMSETYNVFHPTIIYEYDGFNIGAFYNSNRNTSIYVSKDFGLKYDFELELGLVSGYMDQIFPFIKLERNDFFMAPGIENGTIGIIIGKQFKF